MWRQVLQHCLESQQPGVVELAQQADASLELGFKFSCDSLSCGELSHGVQQLCLLMCVAHLLLC